MFVHINSAMRCPLLQLSISPLLLVSGGTTLPCWCTKNRALHKLLKIFQTVSRNLSKSCSKVAKKQSKVFVTKVAQKLLAETKAVLGLMLKYANCTTKVRFLSIVVQFCGKTSLAK